MERAVLFGFSWLRSSLFTAESFLIPVADFLATGRVRRLPFSDLSLFLRVQRSLKDLLRMDAERIASGLYPASVLLQTNPGPLAHIQRLPRLFRSAMDAAKRRQRKTTKSFSASAKKEAANLPPYYARNFHFQEDGYLSQSSAELYDHQVELLFVGAADAMRRLIIAPLKRHFHGSDGAGLRFLELGCGTGSATIFLKAAFPAAEIVAIDLSKPYLEQARRRVSGVDFREGSADDLPFAKGEFDAVVSVFLFHELPLAVRKKVLRESLRVLKSSGVFGFVDSLQLSDEPSLDEALRRFPVEFHEPFYTSYIKTPMDGLLRGAGFSREKTETGFFAKVQTALPIRKKTPRKRKPS